MSDRPAQLASTGRGRQLATTGRKHVNGGTSRGLRLNQKPKPSPGLDESTEDDSFPLKVTSTNV